MKKDTAAQSKHGVLRTHQLVFPQNKGIPLAGRFALRILKRYNAQIVDALRDKEGTK